MVPVPTDALSSSPSSPTPSCSSRLSYMRPWLCNGLAGTPLANLSSMSDSAWAGYYTHFGQQTHDPPMYLELRTAPPPPGSDEDSVPDRTKYFYGKGHDGVGPFIISGAWDKHTGVIDAIKTYEIHMWVWHGVLTPFGLVGTWASEGAEAGGGSGPVLPQFDTTEGNIFALPRL